MALGTGISFRDWVALSGNDADLIFKLSSGTEIITIDNLLTIKPKQISRIKPPAAFGGVKTISFTLGATSNFTDRNGKHGMSIGCLALINHNIPINHPFSFKVILRDFSNSVIYSNTSTNFTSSYKNAKFHHLFDQVYSDVKTAEVHIQIAHDGTYQFNGNFDLGRLWVGNYLEACFNGGHGFSHVNGGNELTSIGNDSTLIQRKTRQSSQYDFSHIYEDKILYDDINWYELSEHVNTGSDILVLPKVENQKVMQKLGIYGKLKKPPNINHVSGPLWEAKLDVIELV